MARKPILRIGGDPSEARAAVRRLRDDVEEFRRTNAEARLQVKADAAEAKITQLRERLDRLSKQEATPSVKLRTARTLAELEAVEHKLDQLDRKDVNIGIGGAFASALQGVSGAASGLLSSLPGLGGAIGAVGAESAAAAPLLIALVVAVSALAASLGAAIAGLGALAVALAGAFGPVIAVAIGVVARLVSVFKALSQQHKTTATSANQVASSHEQVAAATQAVASAQDNLKQQTTAAYQAWQDSIEAVKDDLRDVAHAQLGIQDAALSLREAQQALKDFRAQAGAGGSGLDELFRKATDVSFKGNVGDLIRRGTSGKLSADDELQLERLILNVKQAKLGEKDATDALHDSSVKLGRDRQTEAQFARQGINAYPGYRSAVQGLASAQRQLAAAQRSSATAAVAQQGALAKLSPIERTLAGTIQNFRRLLERAFGPAIQAVLVGINQALIIFGRTLTDPRIRRALTDIGVAIGDAFVQFARVLSTPAMRTAFVQLAEGGARLVRVLSSRVFTDLLIILTRIAVAALPLLLQFVDSIANKLDKWERGTRNAKQLREHITHMIDSLRRWIDLVVGAIGVFITIAGKLKRIGDLIVEAFTHPRRVIQGFISWVGDAIGNYIGHIGDLGRRWGRAFANGFHAAVAFVGQVATGVANAVIGVINIFIRAIDTLINAVNRLPHISTPFGKIGFPHIGAIDPIARLGDASAGANIPKNKLGTGGLVTRAMTALIGEAGDEAVLPLTDDTVMRRLGDRIAASIGLNRIALPAHAVAGAPAGAGGGAGVRDVHVHVHSPAGTAPEPTTAGVQIRNELRRLGLGVG
jgi:TM2 domain-containing membrane protein YozV